MSGIIKELLHPKSSRSFKQMSRNEWFKCNYKSFPYIGMIIGNGDYNYCNFMLIDKNSDISTASVDVFEKHGEFLGYLTTAESVTIHGSLDPDWVEPEQVEDTVFHTMKNEYDITSIPDHVVLSYFDHECGREERTGYFFPSNANTGDRHFFNIDDIGSHSWARLPFQDKKNKKLRII